MVGPLRVPARALFLSEALAARLEGRWLVLPRAEFSQMAASWPLAFHDAYLTYRIGRDAAPHVALAPGAAVRGLEPPLRQDLLGFQVAVGRGQLLRVSDLPPQVVTQADVFAANGEPWLALHHDHWQSLPEPVRFETLARLVADDEPDCLSGGLPDAIRASFGPVALELMGSFEMDSGPNCFATVLAVVLGDRSLAGWWMVTDTFLRGLEWAGLRQKAEYAGGEPEPGAVLVWEDAEGVAQHACVSLGHGLVLNKDARKWAAPRRVLALETVIGRWAEDGFRVWVYSRG